MFTEILEELKAFGTEQNRKVYRRHGVGENQYGVSVANLKALKKKIKINHDLALQLWDTGNHDARCLSMMIADPKKADPKLLERWVRDVDNYVVTDALTGYINRTAFVREKAEAWMPSDDEWVSTAGWGLLGYLALNDKNLPDAYFEPYLGIIERDIHTRKNRVRYAMNNALICIGGRNLHLKQKAQETGERIGEVHVDHGETNCETPDACSYIDRMWARRK